MRNSISIFGQTNNDLLLGVDVMVKKDGVIVATTAPAGNEILIHDNNDGTYYFDVEETFKGTVYVGSNETAQDEMSDVLFYGDDILEHLSESGVHLTVTEKTKVGNLPDDTNTEINSINTALGLKASSEALSTLSTTVDGKASITAGTGMISESGVLSPNLHSDYMTVDSDGKIVIKQQFTNEEVLSSSKTLVQNLERLQQRVLQATSTTVSGTNNPRVIYCDSVINYTPDSTTLSDKEIYIDVSETDEFAFAKIGYQKFMYDNELDISLQANSDQGDYYIIARIFNESGTLIDEEEYNCLDVGYQEVPVPLDVTSCMNNSNYSIELFFKHTDNGISGYIKNIMIVART